MSAMFRTLPTALALTVLVGCTCESTSYVTTKRASIAAKALSPVQADLPKPTEIGLVLAAAQGDPADWSGKEFVIRGRVASASSNVPHDGTTPTSQVTLETDDGKFELTCRAATHADIFGLAHPTLAGKLTRNPVSNKIELTDCRTLSRPKSAQDVWTPAELKAELGRPEPSAIEGQSLVVTGYYADVEFLNPTKDVGAPSVPALQLTDIDPRVIQEREKTAPEGEWTNNVFDTASCVVAESPGAFVAGDYLTVRGTVGTNWMGRVVLFGCSAIGMN